MLLGKDFQLAILLHTLGKPNYDSFNSEITLLQDKHVNDIIQAISMQDVRKMEHYLMLADIHLKSTDSLKQNKLYSSNALNGYHHIGLPAKCVAARDQRLIKEQTDYQNFLNLFGTNYNNVLGMKFLQGLVFDDPIKFISSDYANTNIIFTEGDKRVKCEPSYGVPFYMHIDEKDERIASIGSTLESAFALRKVYPM